MATQNKKVITEFHLDKRLVRSAFDQAAAQYDAVAVLQREVGQRMLDRLDLIRINPTGILDAGAGTGYFSASLSQRYPQSHVIALDLSLAMLEHARRQTSVNLAWRWLTRLRKKARAFVCGDIEHLPLADNCADMIFSNLTLQWCNDLDRVFEESRRVLKPGGLFMFSTFGPDTLKELRGCWRSIDHYTHVNTFIDMHDIGDALLRSNFSEPVMDVEQITLTYKDVKTLMHDLKTLGAHNVTAGRRQTLTGKGRIRALAKFYEKYRRDGVLPASYEVVYGHAWIPEKKDNSSASTPEIRIPLSQLNHGDRQG